MRRERGHSLVELAIVIPLLFGLSFGAIEFSRSLNHMQLATKLSREAARRALQECFAWPDVDEYNICLDLSREKIQAFAEQAHSGTQVVLSVYKHDGNLPADKRFMRVGISPLSAESAQMLGTRVNVTQAEENSTLRLRHNRTGNEEDVPGTQAGDSIIGVRRDVAREHKTIVIAEVFVPFDSIVSSVPSIFNFAPQYFYDATVI